MNNIFVKEMSDIKSLKDREVILISGLPGVANIGKFAIDTIIETKKPEHILEIHSPYLPPLVIPDENNVIKMTSNSIYYLKREEEKDILLWTGDFQPVSAEGMGQFILAREIFEYLKNIFKIEFILTLGGYGTGKTVHDGKVYGAVSDISVKEKLMSSGATFEKDVPPGGIAGMNGLILGFGAIYSIPSGCIMGETSGYIPDPASSINVIKILSSFLSMDIDLTALNEKAEEMKVIIKDLDLNNVHKKYGEGEYVKSKSHLNYIG